MSNQLYILYSAFFDEHNHKKQKIQPQEESVHICNYANTHLNVCTVGCDNESTCFCLIIVFWGTESFYTILLCSMNHIFSPLLADNSPGCTCLVEGKFKGKCLFLGDSVNFTLKSMHPIPF